MNPDVSFSVPSTDGVNVAAYDFGGDGPTLVFCHATGFCAHTWFPMIQAMTSQFRCVGIDLRGHGHTDLPVGVSADWSGMTQDFLAVVKYLGCGVDGSNGPILAVGHSMGGAAIVLGEVAQPGTISRAWLYEPILLPAGPVLEGDNSPAIAAGARRRTATFASAFEVRERYRARPPLSVLDSRVLDLYIEHGFRHNSDGSVTLRCRPEVEASVFEHHQAGGYEAALAINKPVMAGAATMHDMVGEQIYKAAERNPNLEVTQYSGLTHFGPLEQPEMMAVDAAKYLLAESE